MPDDNAFPLMYFGPPEQPLDWRNRADSEPEDDENAPPSPELIAILGFDPRDLDKETTQK